MIHFQVRHLMGVLKCHQLIAVPITTGKKSSSRLSVVTPFQLRPEKKDTVVWPSFIAPFQLPLLRHSNYNQKKKILSSVRCYAIPNTTKKKQKSDRCAIVITTGKKSSSHLSGGCMIVITTGKKNVLVVCLAGA